MGQARRLGHLEAGALALPDQDRLSDLGRSRCAILAMP